MARWLETKNVVINVDAITRIIRTGPNAEDVRIDFVDDRPGAIYSLSNEQLSDIVGELMKLDIPIPKWFPESAADMKTHLKGVTKPQDQA